MIHGGFTIAVFVPPLPPSPTTTSRPPPDDVAGEREVWLLKLDGGATCSRDEIDLR